MGGHVEPDVGEILVQPKGQRYQRNSADSLSARFLCFAPVFRNLPQATRPGQSLVSKRPTSGIYYRIL
jgi:hypothetical protein